jgi:hypothetical protein
LGAVLPFELTRPVLSLGAIAVTSVELPLYVVLLAWAVGRARARHWGWTAVHSAVALWVTSVLTAAVLAPQGTQEALKFALRATGGAALCVATLDLVTTRRQVAWIAFAITIGGVVSGAAALVEVWLPASRSGLELFKTQASYAGGFLRASGTFQYANTAGMYWEAVLPLTLALGAWVVIPAGAPPWRSRTWRWTATAAGVLLAQAVVLSASRAAWWVVAGLLAVMLVYAIRQASALRMPVAVAGLALVLFTLGGWVNGGLLPLRLLSSNEASWLSASFSDPPATLTVPVGAVSTVPMTLRNTGLRDWPDMGQNAVHLSYHWVAEDGNEVLAWNGARTQLGEPVAAGDVVTLPAIIDANVPPGRYRLQWDMVQENIAWFSTLGADTATTMVNVDPHDNAPSIPALPPPFTYQITPRPSRLALWTVALELWAERPLVGIGPDQFRHRYGARLGLEDHDDRTHANSMFVETLVDQGLLGLMALAAVLTAVALSCVRGWRHANYATRVLGLGLGLGLAAFVGHGLVDHFLSFTPTYGLFWLLAGLTERNFSRKVAA